MREHPVTFDCKHRAILLPEEYGDGSAWCQQCGSFQCYTDREDEAAAVADPSVVDACPHCGLEGKPYCWCGEHAPIREAVGENPTPEPSVVDALNTLRDALDEYHGYVASDPTEPDKPAYAALAVVETALADLDHAHVVIGRIAEAAGELRPGELLRERVARAVAAEAERDTLRRERDELGPYFVRDMARLVGLPDGATMDAIYARADALRQALAECGKDAQMLKAMLQYSESPQADLITAIIARAVLAGEEPT